MESNESYPYRTRLYYNSSLIRKCPDGYEPFEYRGKPPSSVVDWLYCNEDRHQATPASPGWVNLWSGADVAEYGGYWILYMPVTNPYEAEEASTDEWGLPK